MGSCAWPWCEAAPRHCWLVFPAGVFVCALHLWAAIPGSGVRCGSVCLGLGFGCAPPFLAGVLGSVFWCVRSVCTPPILAGLCGVGVCAWAQVSAAPRPSWLGCWPVSFSVCAPPVPHQSWLVCAVWVCVLGLGFRLRPAIPGRGVGLCVCVRAPPVPRQSSLGCAVWVCVLGLGFGLRPAIPGWRVGLCVLLCALRLYPADPRWAVRCGCVCLSTGFGCVPPFLAGVLGCVFGCVRSTCTPPLLAGVCSVGVYACSQVSAASRISWLGCVGLCVFVCPLRLYPANPGWGLRCGCVCLRSFLAVAFGCVCVCVCAPPVPRLS